MKKIKVWLTRLLIDKDTVREILAVEVGKQLAQALQSAEKMGAKMAEGMTIQKRDAG